MTHLKPEQAHILRTILRTHLRQTPFTVYVFGSRASGSPRPDSDVDLLLDTQGKIPLSTLAQLKEDFEESELPFRVDVVLRADISSEFYQRIKDDLTLLCAFSGKAKNN